MTASIQILYDEDGPDELDIAAHAVIKMATFSASASAQPDTCEIVLKDVDRELSFTAGRRLKLIVDDNPMWAGFLMAFSRGSFFEGGDGLQDTISRQWVLRGVDNNVLLDKRVLRNPDDYTAAIPDITTNTFDGDILRQAFTDYIDTPSWLDADTCIDNVAIPSGSAGGISEDEPWAWPQHGSKLRLLFEDLAQFSAAVYYVGPDDCVHYHSIQDSESRWGFSDRPNNNAITGAAGFQGAYWGFREVRAVEDGSQIVTDALVWGGSEFADPDGAVVFARATDSTLETEHNKWQLAETHFGQRFYKTQVGVTQRANVIVYGNPAGASGGAEPGSVTGEGPRGLRFPQYQYTFVWYEEPTISGTAQHIYPGDVVPIELWAFSEDGGTTPLRKWLPLRQLKITFPDGAENGQAIVRYEGGFDLRNQDSKFLWTFLRQRGDSPVQPTQTVTSGGGSPLYGSFGQFVPTPEPDGVEDVFTVPYGYIEGTTAVWKDGIRQLLTTDYTESDPEAGEITFTSPPASGSQLFVTDRTLAG